MKKIKTKQNKIRIKQNKYKKKQNKNKQKKRSNKQNTNESELGSNTTIWHRKMCPFEWASITSGAWLTDAIARYEQSLFGDSLVRDFLVRPSIPGGWKEEEEEEETKTKQSKKKKRKKERKKKKTEEVKWYTHLYNIPTTQYTPCVSSTRKSWLYAINNNKATKSVKDLNGVRSDSVLQKLHNLGHCNRASFARKREEKKGRKTRQNMKCNPNIHNGFRVTDSLKDTLLFSTV